MLEEIQSKDVRNLTYDEKTALAAEIRERILCVVSKNGGHLASNLGAVELTIALHSVLDLPEDKLIFDVGHQCYAHKLLTSRNAGFDTLRQFKGISGFTRTGESEYDAVNSGHASDSLSLALGFSRARDLKHGSDKVAVVLGDGAFGGGMCFEALNDAGQSPSQLLIVLNDNEMSISKNVGAFSAHLTHLRQSSRYRRFKQSIKNLLMRMPGNGKTFYRLLGGIKERLKALLIRNDMIFEALGIEYLGPIDGHNIKEMEKTFSYALTISKPVIVHVLTRKGKGYAPAENEPNRFHGVGSFDTETGKSLNCKKETCGSIVSRELCRAAESDGSIVAITAAMASGTGLSAFQKQFPDRFFDVGIAEEHAAAFAGGLALAGMKPCVSLYSTFLQRAYDQISINIALNKAPVFIMVDRAGLNGEDGETHQGVYDCGILRAIPGIVIACPADTRQLTDMTAEALASGRPYALRYPKYLPKGSENSSHKAYKWVKLREGRDICLIASGRMVEKASAACDQLEKQGICAGLVNACYIKPLDTEMLSGISAAYRAVITIEDNCVSCGLGEAVLSSLPGNIIIKTMGVPDMFIPAGTIEQQLGLCGLNTCDIVKATTDLNGELR